VNSILKEYQLKKKAIFLDRDGVINKEKNYLYKISDFEFIDGVFDMCKYLINLDYSIVVVTNQSGIARGYYQEIDYEIIMSWMIDQFSFNGINILDIFHCPHSPDSNCSCRKPKPGMIIEAKNKHNINLAKSWLVGDSERDIEAANSAGIENTVIVRAGYKTHDSLTQAKFRIGSLREIQNIIIK
jgi:D-glycero-D-manno-heptose 1,7-bisphosphate phosphatase